MSKLRSDYDIMNAKKCGFHRFHCRTALLCIIIIIIVCMSNLSIKISNIKILKKKAGFHTPALQIKKRRERKIETVNNQKMLHIHSV